MRSAFYNPSDATLTFHDGPDIHVVADHEQSKAARVDALRHSFYSGVISFPTICYSMKDILAEFEGLPRLNASQPRADITVTRRQPRNPPIAVLRKWAANTSRTPWRRRSIASWRFAWRVQMAGRMGETVFRNCVIEARHDDAVDAVTFAFRSFAPTETRKAMFAPDCVIIDDPCDEVAT